jgi:hypothetical protein
MLFYKLHLDYVGSFIWYFLVLYILGFLFLLFIIFMSGVIPNRLGIPHVNLPNTNVRDEDKPDRLY